jgi:predicted lipoprotein
MSDYDSDILSWSERQAELLRRHVAGERINSADLDWPNIIEEVADVGRNTLRACRSHLLQALLHDLKAKAWPQSRNAPHWRSEARVARINAADAFTPSMRQWIDLTDLYAKAVRAMLESVDGQPPLSVETVCPVTLDELLQDV